VAPRNVKSNDQRHRPTAVVDDFQVATLNYTGEGAFTAQSGPKS